MNDDFYMKIALRLARRGLGKTSPNPMVGAVIVKGGRIIGQGYHRRFSGKHAEINAIQEVRGDINRATLYVTLEPCCHTGKKTPPCLDTLLQHNLYRVVIGSVDPNPQVNGRSIHALKEHGIETDVGILAEACEQLNESYFKYIRTGIPFITCKFAQTLDGRIASASGDSRWISSEPSLKLAHRLRSHNDAVLVGIGTILSDDPELTVRLVRGRNPIRVIVDSNLRIPRESKVLKEQENARTIIATTINADKGMLSLLNQMDIKVLTIKTNREGRIDLTELFEKLGGMGISSVLVEGGAAVTTSLIRQNFADKYIAIIAPRLLGKGIEAVGDLHIPDVKSSIKLSLVKTYRSGEDIVIEARPEISQL